MSLTVRFNKGIHFSVLEHPNFTTFEPRWPNGYSGVAAVQFQKGQDIG